MRTILGYCNDCEKSIYEGEKPIIITNPKDWTFIEHYHSSCFDDKIKFNGFGDELNELTVCDQRKNDVCTNPNCDMKEPTEVKCEKGMPFPNKVFNKIIQRD